MRDIEDKRQKTKDKRQRGRCRSLPEAVAVVACLIALAPPAAFGQHIHDSGAQPPATNAPAATPAGERKILYWYDPMHPQYRSDKPGTAPDCGMELVPMYADEAAAQQHLAAGTVQISPLKQQLTGIRTATVARHTLTKEIHTVGVVQADETRVRKVRTKFPGWVDKLFVSFAGQAVRVGEPIISIYSPELVSTQTEYLLARRGHEQLHESPFAEAAQSSKALLEAARRRLLLWDITPQQIRELEETGRPRTSLTLHSPASGFVTVKDVFAGLYVTPEMDLYTVTDLSQVWVLLDVYEYEMPNVQVGTPVTLSLTYYPGETFSGTVAYVYPYLDGKTRTNKVRVQLDNPGLRLKPDMYANAEIRVPFPDRLAVPESAVLDSGTRQIAFVVTGDGFFQPQQVRLGQRVEGYVEILDGLREGQRVVDAANFMVDSESQLKAALSGMGGMPGMPGMSGSEAKEAAPSGPHQE
jgi:membrane fusion protein, copper/silver efflux system